ncbi:MAG: Chromate resistance protein ChrB [Thermoleophilaceae bacterium]
MSWTLITYRLPSEPSRARVAVWREVRRSGALHLQQSVVAFPDVEGFAEAVARFRALVSEVGGESLAVRAEPLEDPDHSQLLQAWNAARDAECAELASECGKFLAEIDHEFEIEKFTDAELEEEEAELDKLERWRARVAARDVHAAPGATEADAALERAREALARYSQAVFERTRL